MPPKRVARKTTQEQTEISRRRKLAHADESSAAEKLEETAAPQSLKQKKNRVEFPVKGVVEVPVKKDAEAPVKKAGKGATKEGVEAPVREGRRKRKNQNAPDALDSSNSAAQTATSAYTVQSANKVRRLRLAQSAFLPSVHAERMLSCGVGEQLGHPGRRSTRKPRAVDTLPVDRLLLQVVAGGVHSLVLLEDGSVYTCGINDKGTVPVEGVEGEDSTDRFTRINLDILTSIHGKVTMLTAGASFSAALTEKGSVIAWGNLRGVSGCIENHGILQEMEKAPTVIVRCQHKVIVKVAAGENHLVMLSENGELLTFGDGSLGQLGRCSRVSHIRAQRMVDDAGDSLKVSVKAKGKSKLVVFDDIMAGGYWTAAHSTDGKIYVCGLNNYGQLGVPLPEEISEKVVSIVDHPSEDVEAGLKILRPMLSDVFSGKRVRQFSGIQHIIALDEEGNVYGIGKNIDNALGLGTWTGKDDADHWRYTDLAKIDLPSGVTGVSASWGCSVVWTDSGEAYSWGCDTSGQLGLGIKEDDDEKMVPKPRKITSAHLDGYRIVGACMADNHALFLAKKVDP